MTALLRTELKRLLHRRTVVALLVAAIVLPAVVWVTTVWGTRPVSEADLAAARAETEQLHNDEVTACIAHPGDWGIDVQSVAEEKIPALCEDMSAGYEVYVRDQLDLGQLVGGNGTAFGLVTMIAALVFIAGASFAGADWASGSMSNQLLVEPRRARVWTAKGLVVAAVGAVVSAVVLAAFWLGMLLMAHLWDRPAVPDIAQTLLWLNLRGIVLVAVAGLVGYAVAMWFRSSASAVVAILVIALGAELLLRSLPIDNPDPWTPSLNLQAWVQNGAQYWPSNCWDSGCGELGLHHGFGSAALYLAVGAVVVLVFSLLSFRRRDVP